MYVCVVREGGGSAEKYADHRTRQSFFQSIKSPRKVNFPGSSEKAVFKNLTSPTNEIAQKVQTS